jgi:hypothetical protein
MSNASMRVLIGTVALVVGFAIGWMAHRPSAPGPGSHVVKVGPRAADVVPARVSLSKGNHDVLFWIAREQTHEVVIETEEQLFEGQTPQNGRFAVACAGRTCRSGEILASLKPDGQAHKYWQILTRPGEQPETADGWIIIVP